MAEPTLEPYGGKFIMKHALVPATAAEMGMKESKGFGTTGMMAFMLEFDTFEKAMGWFTGPEYAAVLAKRDEVADFKMAVVEAMGGSKAAAEDPRPAEAAPSAPEVAPVAQEVVKCSMRGRRKAPEQKAGRRPQARRVVDFGDHDAGKWVLTSTEYDGSYGIIGGTPVVHEKTGQIQEGLDLLKQEPHRYLSLWYQTDMTSWPTDQQQFSLCERRKQRIVVTESKGAPFTYVESKYHALPDCQVEHGQFTDSMSYAGAPCTEGKQPGTGAGLRRRAGPERH
ncbi:unnamed protein product [Prorocentrum cordatum]|uniref:DUF1330 domain-containing protein n=1 Tax=Prorocentrum cordatum TaxID=2364126 RepID=A0ABN9VKJ1_9DINO|nr:unnamed protein product [Polarella glacialis]